MPTYKAIEHFKSNREVRRIGDPNKAGITIQIVRTSPRDVDEKREYRQIKKMAKMAGMTIEEWKTLRSMVMKKQADAAH